MIWLYSGTPGSGKSYHVAKEVYERLKHGKRVIANTTYNLSLLKERRRALFTYRDNSELTVDFLMEYSAEHHKQGVEGQTLVVVDECSIIWNSRDYSRKDRMQWITFLQQHRKLGYNIIMITQNDRMIDRQIRGFVEYEVKHRNVKNFKLFGALLSLVLGGGSLFAAITYWYGMKERIDVEFMPFRRRIGKFYRTFEIFDESMKKVKEAKAEKGSAADDEPRISAAGDKVGEGAPPRQGVPTLTPTDEHAPYKRHTARRRVTDLGTCDKRSQAS